MLFITLALSLILVALIVVALKNNQQRRLEDLADREQSLPPLDINTDYPYEEDVPAAAVTNNAVTDDAVTDDEVSLSPATSAASTGVTAIEQNDIAAEQTSRDWKQACKEYRQAHQFDQALAAADFAWPQAQSYEQAALTIRAAIKQTPASDSSVIEKWLWALYRVAAESSLLHDRLPEQANSRRSQSSPPFTREELHHIELPWQEIGANELRLLTKTDRKMMVQFWGEPMHHVSAKHWHNQQPTS